MPFKALMLMESFCLVQPPGQCLRRVFGTNMLRCMTFTKSNIYRLDFSPTGTRVTFRRHPLDLPRSLTLTVLSILIQCFLRTHRDQLILLSFSLLAIVKSAYRTRYMQGQWPTGPTWVFPNRTRLYKRPMAHTRTALFMIALPHCTSWPPLQTLVRI
jgi:hypothetical protein